MDEQICPIDPWANRPSCHRWYWKAGCQKIHSDIKISSQRHQQILCVLLPGFWWLEFRRSQYFSTSTAANITEWRRVEDVLPLGPGSIHLWWPSHLSKMFGLFSFQFFVPPQNTQTNKYKSSWKKSGSLSNFPSRQPFSIEISTKKPFQDSPHPKKGKLSLAFYWKWHRITWWFPSSRCHIFCWSVFFSQPIFFWIRFWECVAWGVFDRLFFCPFFFGWGLYV